jgi:hypothetical protein
LLKTPGIEAKGRGGTSAKDFYPEHRRRSDEYDNSFVALPALEWVTPTGGGQRCS